MSFSEDLKESYTYHAALEPFSSFVRREYLPIAISCGVFCAIILFAIFFVDPAFFYPRLQTDPLNYYLKADALVNSGTTAARWAVNQRPFAYAAMPGLLRAPVLFFFNDFDDQLRGIQILNIPILTILAIMSAYILSWTQPARRHWMVIVFSFLFILLSPVWIANIFLPLADAPFAAFSTGAVLVAMSLICSPVPAFRRPGMLALFAVLFIVASSVRFTGPAVLAFAAALSRGRWNFTHLSRRNKTFIWAGAVATIGALLAFNMQAILGRYLIEPFIFIVKGDKLGMILNVLAVALPSQVIPTFTLGFVHPPNAGLFAMNLASTIPDAAWMFVGLSISLIIIIGALQARRTLLPEIVYFLVPLPVLGLMMPSTTRYLMSFQPFIWIFFYLGLVRVTRRHRGLIERILRQRVAVAASLLLAIGGFAGLRIWKLAGTASEKVLAVSVNQAPQYISGVSSTFRGLRSYLETLPRDRTLLIGDRGAVGRWTLITGLPYYAPDSALSNVARTKDVYMLAECGILDVCQSWPYFVDLLEKRVNRYGAFRFDSTYATQSSRARVQVFRVTPVSE